MAYTAYYRLNGDGVDAMGTYHLTNLNATTFISGKFSSCANFVAASNQELYVLNNLGITGGNITMSIWVNNTSQPAESKYFVHANQSSATNNVGNCFYYKTTGGAGKVYFDRVKYSVAFNEATVMYTLTNGVWYNLIYTYDGSNVRGYINGALAAGPTASSGNGTSGGVDYFSIGNDYGGTTLWSDAKIDEVIVESRAWTAAQIKNYYNFSMGRYAPKMRW